MRKISFVIPCYRSQQTVSAVVGEITSIAEIQKGYDYEILLVNDGSPDAVWSVIQKLAEKNSRVRGISLAKNFGQHSALMAGYAHCEGDYIVSVDDDGQIPLEVLPKLVEKLEEGYDAVYAYYEQEVKKSPMRRFGTWMSRSMSRMMLASPKGLRSSSFFIARKFVIEEMLKYENPYPYLPGLVLRTTNNVSCIPAVHRNRIAGSSSYSFVKLLSLWMNGFTAFSILPLRLAELIGIFCSVSGFLGGIFVIVRKLRNPAMLMGYSSTIAVIFFIGGVIMLLLGIIGEYVGRIYISINRAPQYVVRERTKGEWYGQNEHTN